MTGDRPRVLLAALTAATAIGVVALILSIQAALTNYRQDSQREDDRIASDIAACERGNEFRQDVIDLGTANEEMVSAILDAVFTTSDPERNAAVEALRNRLDQPIDTFHQTIAAIVLVDCEAVTPGTRSSP